MITQRIEGWEERLNAVVEAARHRPFGWGKHDCCTFAADAVNAVARQDLSESWPRYDSEAEALRVVRNGGGLAAMVEKVLGAPVAPALARRGDIVMLRRDLPEPWMDALGVCVGLRAACASRKGLAFVPLGGCTLAWRVG